MGISNYVQILGILDKLYDLNEKFNKFADENLGSVWVGAAIFGAILVIVFWGIGNLNKKQ